MKILAFMALLLVFMPLTGASTYFKVIDITPVTLQPNSQASFTVTIQNLGTETEAVGLLFRNLIPGLLAANMDGTPYIFPVQIRRFNCTMIAEDVAPGNSSFGVGVYAHGAIPSWRDSYVLVQSTGSEVRPVQQSPMPIGDSLNASRSLLRNILGELNCPALHAPSTHEGNKTRGRASPGAGAVIALAALLIATGRFKR
jgi:hypothetical protein